MAAPTVAAAYGLARTLPGVEAGEYVPGKDPGNLPQSQYPIVHRAVAQSADIWSECGKRC